MATNPPPSGADDWVTPKDDWVTPPADHPTTKDDSTAIGTFFRNIPHGLADLAYGGAQTIARMTPMPPDFGGFVPLPADYSPYPDPAVIKQVDEATKQRAAEIAKEPGQKTHPWAATLGDIGGQAVGTAPLFAPLGALPSLGARAIGAAIPGGITALLEPVTGDHFGKEKAGQVATGTIGAMIGEPVSELASKGVGWLIRKGVDAFRDPATVAARKAAEEEARATEKAGKRISETVAEGQKGGGPTAPEIKQTIEEARGTGQPYTVLDAGPTETERLGGTAYRSPGGGGTRMKKAQEERTTKFGEQIPLRTAQTQRLSDWIHRFFGTESAQAAGERLAAERSAAAKPLYEEAYAGGSMAPLEQRFTNQFTELTQRAAAAAQKLREANSRLVAARAQQQTSAVAQREAATTPAQIRAKEIAQAGKEAVTGVPPPEPSPSGFNEAEHAAARDQAAAEQELRQTQAELEAARTRLRRAQADGTANAPGAVWSPRLQQFLDDPEIAAGLRHGAKLEKDRALTEGRPFNPSEYAITGFDENGEPVIGSVPNMKLLQKGKQALDGRLYHDEKLRDKFGRKTEEWWVLDGKRRAFVEELDRLNPKYKEARDAWAEGSAMMEASEFGKTALADLKAGRLTIEQMTARWQGSSASEREVFKHSLGNQIIADFDRARTTGTAANILNSNAAQEMVRMVFDTDEEFQTFRRFLEREQRMSNVGHRVMSGSQSMERAEATAREASRMDAAHHMIEAISRARHLNPKAAASLWRAVQAMRGGSTDEAYNRKLAEMLTDPNIELSVSPDGKLLVGPQTPPKPPGLSTTVAGPAGGDIGAIIGSRRRPAMSYSVAPPQ